MPKPNYAVLFPAFDFALREPDPIFQKETTALEAAGIPVHVVNTNALMDGDLPRAFQYLGESSADQVIYRGWILHPPEYESLETELSRRGFNLFTSHKSYRKALLFPEFFPLIEPFAIPATWIHGHNPMHAIQAAKALGNPPYYIKDYVKSAKAIAPQGCIVPAGHLKANMTEAIADLKEYRADRFESGIVIRPLLKLRYLEECPFGGPIYEEYRLFFFRGQIISQTIYDRVGGDPQSLPDFSFLSSLIPSPFFTADIAVTDEGKTLILEIGDGGVSGLPPTLDPAAFYQQISRSMESADR